MKISNFKVTFFVSFYFLQFFKTASANQCLRNVQIVSTEEQAVSVAWDNSCSSAKVLYKVYLEHREWKACATGQKDTSKGPGIRTIEIEGKNALDIDGLHPFSTYKITVKAIVSGQIKPDEDTVMAETKQSTPDVAPQNSSKKPTLSADRIEFHWRAPLPSECSKHNGELTGFYYVLKPESPWALDDPVRSGWTKDPDVTMAQLRPVTKYTLSVYATTISNSSFNADKYLLLTEKTLGADQLVQPVNLKVERKNTETVISWLPEYPPTSEVGSYQIKWRSEKTNFSDINFLQENSFCPISIEPEPHRLCFSITQSLDSLSMANLTFQVRAVAPNGVRISPWSEEVTFYPNNPNGDDNTSMITIIVVVVVAVLFAILIVTFVSYHCRQRVKNYKNVPDYEAGRRSVSFVSNSTSGLIINSGSSSLPPPYPSPAHQNSLFGFPNEQASIETTSTILSSVQVSTPTTSYPGFSLPTAQPRTSRLTASMPRTSAGVKGQAAANPTTKIDTSRYQHLLLPTPKTQPVKRPGSIQETPLPPLPSTAGREPIYEELCQDTLLSRRRFKSNNDISGVEPMSAPPLLRRKSAENDFPMSTVRVEFGTGSTKHVDTEEEEEEFLKPTLNTNDDDYLKPRVSTKVVDVVDGVDDDEYLKPTFGRFDRISSRDLSPPTELPPPIPMQSYSPVRQN